MALTNEQMVQQHLNRRVCLTNSDKIYSLGFGLYDLFSGEGWKNHTRFRVVKFREKDKPSQIFTVSGMPLSREYRELLLKEVH